MNPDDPPDSNPNTNQATKRATPTSEEPAKRYRVSRKKPPTPPATLLLTIEVARQQAQAEKLTLLVADNKTGFFGVHLNKPGRPKPYEAQVRRGGKKVYLGTYTTAEEAALCVARSPEGQAEAANRAAAAAPLTSEVARRQAQAEKLSC